MNTKELKALALRKNVTIAKIGYIWRKVNPDGSSLPVGNDRDCEKFLLALPDSLLAPAHKGEVNLVGLSPEEREAVVLQMMDQQKQFLEEGNTNMAANLTELVDNS